MAGTGSLTRAALDRLSELIATGDGDNLRAALVAADALIAAGPAPGPPEARLRKGVALRWLRRLDAAEATLRAGLMLALDDDCADGFDRALADVAEARLLEGDAGGTGGTGGGGGGGGGGGCGYDDGPDAAAFRRFEAWLRARRTCAFPHLALRRYARGPPGDDWRGVHARRDVPAQTELLRVGREYLITAEMGRACPVGAKVQAALDAGTIALSAQRHAFLAVYLLWDAAVHGEQSFHAPYYALLPRALPGSPMEWTDADLALLQGSHVATVVAERRAAYAADYDAVCAAAPEFARLAGGLGRWVWARLMVASRNFSVVLDGRRTDALVPLADMLNHRRPRQTMWGFNAKLLPPDGGGGCEGGGEGSSAPVGSPAPPAPAAAAAGGAFVITSLVPLTQGQQVHDSYGVKCVSRYLLGYGFTVHPNVEAGSGQCPNEVRLLARLRSPAEDPYFLVKMRLLGEGQTARPVSISAHYGIEGTAEAFSWLRFVWATGHDVMALPADVGPDYDWTGVAIPPLSEANETAVVRALARLCADALGRYPTTLEQDRTALEAADAAVAAPSGGGGSAPLSQAALNRRNALVLRVAEKTVLRHYVDDLPRAVDGVLLLGDRTAAMQRIIDHHAGRDPVSEYIRAAIAPLVRRRPAATAAAAAGGGAAASIAFGVPSGSW
jgi:hypothetical protein